MKTACLIIYRLGVGGAEQMVVAEISELMRRGYAVTLITLSPERAHTLIGFVPAACARETVLFRSVFDLSALVALSRRLARLKPDLIITQLWFANTVGRIAARIAKVDQHLIAFEQNVYDRVKSWKQYLADRLLQRWCRRIVAISASVRDSLVRHGIEAKRITVVHNAIDLARIDAAAPAQICSELGIGDDFLYLFVGRLVPQKAVDMLLPAFAAQERGTLILAGDGEDRAALQEQARALGIEDRVHFLGVRHDVPSLMKSADCFVLPSRWEGFGVVLAEAMAAGLPIVATHVDGISEVVEDGIQGILVPPEDVASLSEALRTMRTDANLRNEMATKASVRASMFSIERHIDEVLGLLA